MLCKNIAREPLYLFINEHSTASLRCRSGSLEIPAADHMQSSLYFQAGCTADSCTLECVRAAGRRGDTCALATQVKPHLPSRGFPECSPIPSARPPHHHLPSRHGPQLLCSTGAFPALSRHLSSKEGSTQLGMPNNQGGLWLREESACTFRAALPSPAVSCHSGDPTCGEVQ